MHYIMKIIPFFLCATLKNKERPGYNAKIMTASIILITTMYGNLVLNIEADELKGPRENMVKL